VHVQLVHSLMTSHAVNNVQGCLMCTDHGGLHGVSANQFSSEAWNVH